VDVGDIRGDCLEFLQPLLEGEAGILTKVGAVVELPKVEDGLVHLTQFVAHERHLEQRRALVDLGDIVVGHNLLVQLRLFERHRLLDFGLCLVFGVQLLDFGVDLLQESVLVVVCKLHFRLLFLPQIR